jgi:DNA-binding winged helix-turn-helix (wHTH) protein/TolB-like protein
MSTFIELAQFRFDIETGELHSIHNDANGKQRLAPQPAQLLNLLISHYPSIVTHEEIQNELWPGVKTEFDGNLHFCVRQIRSALGDTAANPKFIETIPRRGYRLIVDPTGGSTITGDEPTDSSIHHLPAENGKTASSDNRDAEPVSTGKTARQHSAIAGTTAAKTTSSTDRYRRISVGIGTVLIGAALIGAVLIGGLVWYSINQQTNNSSNQESVGQVQPIRIAVMPFKNDNPQFKELGSGSIAELLLDSFAGEFGNSVDLIGPSTTAEFSEMENLSQLISTIRPKLIVNGRFVQSSSGDFLLAEIIRASDGAHIWVRRYTADASDSEIVDHIKRELVNLVK